MQATINFRFHGELYVTRLTVKMMVKQLQLLFTMRLDDTSVIYKPFPKFGLVKSRRQGFGFKMLHEERLATTGERGEPIATPQVCSKNSSSKLKKVEVKQILTKKAVSG